MNREKKTTLMLTVNGRADFIVQDAASYQRPSTRNGVGARVGALFLGFILATLICPAPVLAGPYSASGYVLQEFYAAGAPGASSVSPTGATFTQQFVTGDIYLYSSAEASSGNLSLSALTSINNMGNWASGHVWSVARGSITEPVAPLWEIWNEVRDGSLVFEYQIWVGGSLTAISVGEASSDSQAGLIYSYGVGDSNGTGTWSLDSAGRVWKNGTWNSLITSSFTVDWDDTFDLELAAAAVTYGGKTYFPGSQATILAIADFSHTMTWLGITGVQAFDSKGNEVPLPSDFYLPLIGRDSGFDYWYSAAEPAPVPEPPTVLLLGSGLFVAGLIRKSVVRRRDS